ncbi:MAG: response regulator [Crocinitomix sp.]|nr:response regulator [Crocinitomix sp.]
MKYNVLLIDDNPIYLKGLNYTLLLSPLIEDIYKSKKKEKARLILDENNIHLAFIDLDLNSNEYDGFQLAKEWKKEFPILKIIIVSSHIKVDYANYLLNTVKVDGYLSKLIDDSEILKAVESVYNGRQYLDQELQSIRQLGKWRKVSEREFQVLHLLAQGKIKKEIALLLHLSENTIVSHTMNLRVKIGAINTPELVAKYIQYKKSNYEHIEDRIPPFLQEDKNGGSV